MVFGFSSDFSKATLRVPPQRGKEKLFVIKKPLLSRFYQWQQGDLITLWKETRQEGLSQLTRQSASISKVNARRSLNLSHESRFGDAIKALRSHGCDDAPMRHRSLSHVTRGVLCLNGHMTFHLY